MHHHHHHIGGPLVLILLLLTIGSVVIRVVILVIIAAHCIVLCLRWPLLLLVITMTIVDLVVVEHLGLSIGGKCCLTIIVSCWLKNEASAFRLLLLVLDKLGRGIWKLVIVVEVVLSAVLGWWPLPTEVSLIVLSVLIVVVAVVVVVFVEVQLGWRWWEGWLQVSPILTALVMLRCLPVRLAILLLLHVVAVLCKTIAVHSLLKTATLIFLRALSSHGASIVVWLTVLHRGLVSLIG